MTFSSPMVSSDNLMLSGGEITNLTAAQEMNEIANRMIAMKKPLGQIVGSPTMVNRIRHKLAQYTHLILSPNKKGYAGKDIQFTVAQKGTLNQHFDMAALSDFYSDYGLDGVARHIQSTAQSGKRISDYLHDWDWQDKTTKPPDRPWTGVQPWETGLILGFPIESTLSRVYRVEDIDPKWGEKVPRWNPKKEKEKMKHKMFRLQRKPGSKWLFMPQMKENGRWVSLGWGYMPKVDAQRAIKSAQEEIEKRAKRHNNPRRRRNPQWIKAYRAVNAGVGIKTDAIKGAAYFFPRRSTAELWASINNATVIEREIRIDTAHIMQVAEGDIPYFACDENDVIIRMFPDVRNPQIPKDIAEILVCDDRFVRKVSKSSLTNPRRRRNPGLKVGDRIQEGKRKGTVKSFHSKGTVDVLFDDMDYVIRRQLGSVKRINPRRKNGVSTPKNTNWILNYINKHSRSRLNLKQLRKYLDEQGDWWKLQRVKLKELDPYTHGSVKPSGYEDVSLPIVIARDGEEIIDGRHRTVLAAAKGLSHVDAYVPYAHSEMKKMMATKKTRRKNSGRQALLFPPKRKPVLVIACGNKKEPGRVPVHQKYLGGLWQQYRASAPSIPSKDMRVFVMSAKHGLLPETEVISSYNRRLVPDSKRTLERGERRVSTIIPELVTQIKRRRFPDTIYFSGSAIYLQALREAARQTGRDVIDLQEMRRFPGRTKRGGIGKQRGALNWFLGST